MANKKIQKNDAQQKKIEGQKLSKNKTIILAVIAVVVVFGITFGIIFATQANTTPVKVQFEMADGGKMVFQLEPKYAPKTVANFVKLVNEGFYDGLKFHRIIKGFMAQGGDGAGVKPEPQNIFGEFAKNGFPQNTLSHTRGVISMARTDPNTANSQFFIVTGEPTYLDGDYAAFGKLITGDDTLQKIEDTPTDPNSPDKAVPIKDVVIKRITVVE